MAKRVGGKLFTGGSVFKVVSGFVVGLILGVALGDKFEWFEKLPIVGKFFV